MQSYYKTLPNGAFYQYPLRQCEFTQYQLFLETGKPWKLFSAHRMLSTICPNGACRLRNQDLCGSAQGPSDRKNRAGTESELRNHSYHQLSMKKDRGMSWWNGTVKMSRLPDIWSHKQPGWHENVSTERKPTQYTSIYYLNIQTLGKAGKCRGIEGTDRNGQKQVETESKKDTHCRGKHTWTTNTQT